VNAHHLAILEGRLQRHFDNKFDSFTQLFLTHMADVNAQFQQAVADLTQATNDAADRVLAKVADLKGQLTAGISRDNALAAIASIENEVTAIKAIGVDPPAAPVPAPPAPVAATDPAPGDTGTPTGGSTGTENPATETEPATE
jgi:hypothetical protein